MSKVGANPISLGKIATLRILLLFSKTEIRVCTTMFGLVSKHDTGRQNFFWSGRARSKMRNSGKQTVVKFSANSNGECC